MKRVIKKVISICISTSMMVTLAATAVSADANDFFPSVELVDNIICNEPAAYDDYLNGSVRSTSLPKDPYDLSAYDYYASLDYVNKSWLYTNFHFKPNDNGEIYVQYTIYSDTGRPTPMEIGVYDLDAKKMAVTTTSGDSTLNGITEAVRFYNLNKDHKYAVAFTAVSDGFSFDSIHGSATISHKSFSQRSADN